MLSDMSRNDSAPGNSAPGNSAPADSVRVSTDLVIETPENVVLTYRLAGPAVRLLAYLIDFAIRGILMFAAFVLVIAGGIAGSFGVSIGLYLILWFAIDWAYFGLSEGYFRGKT